MKDFKERNGSDVSLATVLLIIFVVLKLTGLINWSWLWVLSPIWIPICLGLFLFVIGLLLEALS